MFTTFATLLDRLDRESLSHLDVITWGAPVPVFGAIDNSLVATVGLNPSNREFVDNDGSELFGSERRFHTLASLGLTSWADAEAWHIEQVIQSCERYFYGNPYDRWFRRLDQILKGTGCSFYDQDNVACHLDLIPFATESKWTSLSRQKRIGLLEVAGDTLSLLLRESDIQVLVLNGKSVVDYFQRISQGALKARVMKSWSLPRRKGSVQGVAYSGVICELGGAGFDRDITVLGYNHNIQSSFGVTNDVICAISDWVGREARKALR